MLEIAFPAEVPSEGAEESKENGANKQKIEKIIKATDPAKSKTKAKTATAGKKDFRAFLKQ